MKKKKKKQHRSENRGQDWLDDDDDDDDEMVPLPQAATSLEGQTQQLSLRRDKLLPKLQKILLTVESPDYRSKVPAPIREKMEAKVSSGRSAGTLSAL